MLHSGDLRSQGDGGEPGPGVLRRGQEERVETQALGRGPVSPSPPRRSVSGHAPAVMSLSAST